MELKEKRSRNSLARTLSRIVAACVWRPTSLERKIFGKLFLENPLTYIMTIQHKSEGASLRLAC